MPITAEDIANMFHWHHTNTEQQDQMSRIRQAAKALADTILANSSPSADQTHAIRLVRTAVMFANASITMKGKY